MVAKFTIHKRIRDPAAELANIEKREGIHPSNLPLFRDFVSYLYAEGLSNDRIHKYLQHLKFLAVWFGGNLTDVTKDDAVRLLSAVAQKDFSDWTKRDYRIALKRFMAWLRQEKGYPDDYPDATLRGERLVDDELPTETKWVTASVRRGRKIDPDDLVTEEDVRSMAEAATHPRDRALVYALYEGGFRQGELMSLRIKNIEPCEAGFRVRVDGKTGERRVLLLAAAPYLAQWLNIHPFRGDREAPLWIQVGSRNNALTGHERTGTIGSMQYATFRKLLQTLAARAGVKKKVNPHAFRHARATFLAKYMTESQLKQFFGWDQASEMAGIYVHLSGRDTDDAVMRVYGIEKKGSPEPSSLTPQQCPACMQPNAPAARFCSRCGRPMSLRTAMKVEDANQMLNELVKNPEGLKELAALLAKHGLISPSGG